MASVPDKGGDESVGGQKKKVIRIKKSAKTKKSNVPKNKPLPGHNEGRFVTMQLGTDEDVQSAEMEERMQDARGWVSKKLSDEDARMLNRAMGIEAEVLAAIAAEEDEGQSGSSKANRLLKSAQAATTKGKKGRERAYDRLSNDKAQAAAMVKGFLEMNPYVCSGCGAPFQKSSPDSPGYLPSDKLQEHRANAGAIRDKQEAIKILEMAGIEIDSSDAEDILRGANVSDDVISGVRALGQGSDEERDSRGSFDADGESDFEEDELLDELYATQNAALDDVAAGSPGGNALKHKERIAELKTHKRDVDSREDDLDGLEIDVETLLRGEGDVSSAKRAFLAGGGLVNDIDSEANPVSKQNNQWREYAKALDDESRRDGRSSTSFVEEEEHGIYEDLGAEAALNSFDKNRGVSGNRADAGDTSKLNIPVCICQRCYRLQTYGQVEQQLRPGWSDHDLLTPAHFQHLLGGIRDTNAVVLCLVDLFDLEGSILKNLRTIAGHNPIVIAANKIDLLPRDVSHARLLNWIHAEVRETCGLVSPREYEQEVRREIEQHGWSRRKLDAEEGVLRRSNIHLVSCSNGAGMRDLMSSVMGMAENNGNKVYVMGAANVGKSSFINNLLENTYERGNDRMRSRKKNKSTPQATVSNLPGTTLNFLNIRLPNGITMIDTPGLLNSGQLTTKLTTDELRQVIPATPINPVTLRVTEGKTVLIGGLAKVEMLEGLPFFVTFFVSNEIRLHPTSRDKANDQAWLEKHCGGLISPPSSAERLAELGPMESRDFEVYGDSWRSAATDLVISGLGWISITGTGPCKIRVTAPKGTAMNQREALLPYEASHSTAKFTGGKILKRSRKQGQSYGWRAGS